MPIDQPASGGEKTGLTASEIILVNAIGGLAVLAFLVLLVNLPHESYGAVCAKSHQRDSLDWQKCVHDLAAKSY